MKAYIMVGVLDPGWSSGPWMEPWALEGVWAPDVGQCTVMEVWVPDRGLGFGS